MNAKEYLKQLAAMYSEIALISEQYVKAYETATRVTPIFTDMPPAPSDERKDAALVALAAVGAELDEHRRELQDAITATLAAIRKVPNSLHRQLLAEYFFEMKTQREMGKRLGYTQQHIGRLLTEAIAIFEEVFVPPEKNF
jgi:DNA-directed RNA polymerase specialized sigma subunit